MLPTFRFLYVDGTVRIDWRENRNKVPILHRDMYFDSWEQAEMHDAACGRASYWERKKPIEIVKKETRSLSLGTMSSTGDPHLSGILDALSGLICCAVADDLLAKQPMLTNTDIGAMAGKVTVTVEVEAA